MRALIPFSFLFSFLVLALLAPPARANGIMVTGSPGEGPGRQRLRTPVRLTQHRVDATVTDTVAEVTVEQTFFNDSGRQLEGTYLFPLPEGAAVGKFSMTMLGKMVQGEIIEAKQARRIYEGIVRRSRDPGLLEYMGRGLFRARVFPIEPRKDLTIKLTFQQVLPEDAGTIEWRYPLATDRMNGAPVDRVFVKVDVESSVDLKAIYSPTHTAEVQRSGDRAASVTYERSGLRQSKDFLLYVGRSPDAVGFSFLSHKAPAEDGTFMTVLAPKVEVKAADRVPKDIVYVLDTSGSMAGEKIQQAREALKYGVRTLDAGDRFDVIAFSTGVRPFREKLVQATPDVREAAAAWIDGLGASGGTNIAGALVEAMKRKSAGRLFMVVFITDGRPTVGDRDAAAILARVEAENAANVRVFTFGVGYDLDVALLDRIAEATNGARDYVTPGEDIEIVTGRFFRKVAQPVLSNVRVEMGEGVYDVYPQKLPDLFAGGQVVVFGRYRAAGERLIRLTGDVAGKPVTYDYEAKFRGGEGAGFLPRLWAHRKVAFLLDEIRLHGENEELVNEVVRLATRHAIVTPYTAGLVVEDGAVRREEVLFQIGGRNAGVPPRDGRGKSGAPGGAVPPGMRGPSDPTPPPPAPPSGAPPRPLATPDAPAPTTPALPPKAAADASKDLDRRKKGFARDDDGKLAKVREKVRAVGGKSFVLREDGRWTDTAWDGKQETKKIEALSDAYFELMAKGDKVAKYLALGERVVFVLDETAYEIVPAPEKADRPAK
jgi:Ca-activated chloride channel family protein